MNSIPTERLREIRDALQSGVVVIHGMEHELLALCETELRRRELPAPRGFQIATIDKGDWDSAECYLSFEGELRGDESGCKFNCRMGQQWAGERVALLRVDELIPMIDGSAVGQLAALRDRIAKLPRYEMGGSGDSGYGWSSDRSPDGDWVRFEDLEMAVTMCDQCDKNPSNHTAWAFGLETHLCCQCYVAAGNAPADWHPECMKAAGRGLAEAQAK